MTEKTNSKLFEQIRIKPRRHKKEETEQSMCEWAGCDRPGLYKAPRTAKEGSGFRHFCLEHVRAYNQKFDYFAGAETADKLGDMLNRAARYGDRPTWKMGTNAKGAAPQTPYRHRPRDFSGKRFSDPLNLFARLARNQGQANPIRERELRLSQADKRALETLGLEGAPEISDIKKAYKDLVKKHHPDANGGDRGSEERLRAIIAAYTHLKKKGYT